MSICNYYFFGTVKSSATKCHGRMALILYRAVDAVFLPHFFQGDVYSSILCVKATLKNYFSIPSLRYAENFILR
jgi:hypothetical protein